MAKHQHCIVKYFRPTIQLLWIIGGETGNWHRNLNATIGYSNPTKLTFGTACNIIVEKIFAENRIRHAQRGDYACLDQRAGSTALHDTVGALPLLDLPMHKQYRRGTIKTMDNIGAMRKHMMT